MRLKGEYARRLLGKCCLDPNLLPLDSIVSEGEQSHGQIYLSTNWLTKSLQIDRAVLERIWVFKAIVLETRFDLL